MPLRTTLACRFAGAFALGLLAALVAGLHGEARAADRPTPVLTAVPMVAASPARIVMRATLRGGEDDDPDFYCPTVEWDWDDGSVSEHSRDCDPYEKGKSLIERNFTAQHEFKEPAEYRVTFKLKKGNRVITTAWLRIRVS